MSVDSENDVCNIQIYLARVRSLHVRENMTPGWEHSQVAPALRGVANNPDGVLETRNRVPVTPFLMKKLKFELHNSLSMTLCQKRLLWLFATWAYCGSFRSADLLSEKAKGYRPGSTLLYDCVKWHSEVIDDEVIEYITVKVKEPKEQKRANSNALVELLPLNTLLCPVKAYKKFLACNNSGKEGDKLIFSDGKLLLTAAKVNRWLRKLLKSHVDYNNEQILGHSFR